MIATALSAVAGFASGAWRRLLPWIAAAAVLLGVVAQIFRSGRRAGADAVRADVARRDAAAAERARAAGQSMTQAQVEARPSTTAATVARLRDRQEI
jgi:type VI protein secretion system component VasF